MVSVTGGTEEDIISRIRKAQEAFASLRSVWKARAISLETKLRIFNYNVKSDNVHVATTIRRKKWKWIGHTLRKERENTTRMAMDWNPQGKRKRGRPKQSWRRTVITENTERTWGEVKRIENNRVRWKAMVEALYLSRGKDVQVK